MTGHAAVQPGSANSKTCPSQVRKARVSATATARTAAAVRCTVSRTRPFPCPMSPTDVPHRLFTCSTRSKKQRCRKEPTCLKEYSLGRLVHSPEGNGAHSETVTSARTGPLGAPGLNREQNQSQIFDDPDGLSSVASSSLEVRMIPARILTLLSYYYFFIISRLFRFLRCFRLFCGFFEFAPNPPFPGRLTPTADS
jgi:hypothetical protein